MKIAASVEATSLRDVLPGLNPERPVLFGGSTHRGEEEILAKIFARLRQKFPSLCLFIAPRHVERVREIRAQLEALPLQVRLASEAANHSEAEADCVLLDTTGELRRWYSIATVVFIGKSMSAHGGQNPVEPIMAAQAGRIWSAHGEFRYAGGNARIEGRRHPGS